METTTSTLAVTVTVIDSSTSDFMFLFFSPGQNFFQSQQQMQFQKRK